MQKLVAKIFGSKCSTEEPESMVDDIEYREMDQEEEEYVKEFYRQKQQKFYPYAKKRPKTLTREETTLTLISQDDDNEEILKSLRKNIKEEIYFAMTERGSIELSITNDDLYYVSLQNGEEDRQLWYSKDLKVIWSSCEPFLLEFKISSQVIQDLKQKMEKIQDISNLVNPPKSLK